MVLLMKMTPNAPLRHAYKFVSSKVAMLVAFVQRASRRRDSANAWRKRDVKHAAIVFAIDSSQYHAIMFNTVPEGLPRHLLRTLAGEQYVNRYAIE